MTILFLMSISFLITSLYLKKIQMAHIYNST